MVEKKKFTINSKDLGVAENTKLILKDFAFHKNMTENGSTSIKRCWPRIYGRNKCPVCEVLA
jgi:hypothetical protein